MLIAMSMHFQQRVWDNGDNYIWACPEMEIGALKAADWTFYQGVTECSIRVERRDDQGRHPHRGARTVRGNWC